MMKRSNKIIQGCLLVAATSLMPLLSAKEASTTEVVTLNIALDHAVLPADDVSPAYLKVGLMPELGHAHLERAPINLVIVLDKSGSMSGAKIETAKQAAIQAIGMLQPHDRVSVVAYSDQVRNIIPLQAVRSIHDPLSRIASIRSSGNTAIYAGIEAAANQLRRRRSEDTGFSRILLLSDGLANVGPSAPRDFAALGRSLSLEGISVSTVGLGSDYNEDLMAELSKSGQGNTYFAENYNDLNRIFDSELGDVTSVVAQSIQVEIECQPGFRPVRFLGRSGTIKGRKALFEINHLYGGQEKLALVELESTGGQAKAIGEVARISVRYQDSSSKETRSLMARSSVTYSDKTETVEKSVNIDVQRIVAQNRIAEAQEEAIRLADKGQEEQAVAMLKATSSSIIASNSNWNDSEIDRYTIQLNEQTEELEAQGLSKVQRKDWRSSSYNIQNQQKSYKK